MVKQNELQEGQIEQFSFYRFPKALIKDKKYQHISIEAKIVYGLFLDRLSLSKKNDWRDGQGQVFIIYTVQELKGDFGCSGKKIGRVLAELEQADLIVRKRQGLCKPNLIYVKALSPEGKGREDNKLGDSMSGDSKSKSEATKGKFQKRHLETSGGDKKNILESAKGTTNKTDKNKTEKSETEINLKEGEGDKAQQIKKQNAESIKQESIKQETMKQAIKEEIEKQLDYAMLQEEYPYEAEQLAAIIEVLAEAFSSKRQEIRVGGEEKPAEEVKQQLKQLNHRHIEYVLDCLRQNTSKVQNVFAYLLTVLYHAPMTIKVYYDRLVRHDMAKRRR